MTNEKSLYLEFVDERPLSSKLVLEIIKTSDVSPTFKVMGAEELKSRLSLLEAGSEQFKRKRSDVSASILSIFSLIFD